MAASVLPPPLLEGDCLTSDEFMRRWEQMPDLMRAEVLAPPGLEARADEVRNYAPSAEGGIWPRTDVSPQLWTTMLDLIYSGHAGDAWKFFNTAWPAKMQGKDAFASAFRAQLAKSPYWPAVSAMNSETSP